MITYPTLGLPEAWKPLFKAMADQSWQPIATLRAEVVWACREVLAFECEEKRCYLSLFEEAEWCGNNYQQGALTVVGLSADLPTTRDEAEAHSLPLTGNWERRGRCLRFRIFPKIDDKICFYSLD